MIAELTVPFEPNMEKAHDRKQNKYASLVHDLNKEGIKTSLICFEVGSRGLVTKDNMSRIRSMFKFTRAKCNKQVIRNISKLALLGSYSIWNCTKEPNWDNIEHLNIKA